MKRAILVALGTGVVISSAAGALDIAGAGQPPGTASVQSPVVHAARARAAARSEQRERIHARYLAQRSQCAAFRGHQRETCLVQAHAARGRALLEAAAPYEARS